MCGIRFAPYYQKLGLDFSVEKKTTPGKENSMPHIHDQYELLFCLSDHMCFDVDSGSGTEHHLIRKNTLLLINNMDRHYFYPEEAAGENFRYVVYFDPAYIDSLSTDEVSLLDCFLFRPFPSAQILCVSQEQSQFLQQLLDKILDIDQRPAETFYGKALYLRLLRSCCSMSTRSTALPITSPPPRPAVSTGAFMPSSITSTPTTATSLHWMLCHHSSS